MEFNPDRFAGHLQTGTAKAGFPLSREQVEAMTVHARELVLWNRKMNLTAIKDAVSIAEKHFIDAVLVHPLLGGVSRMMDMGSGGGFPAVPLKVLNPDMALTMVDSVRKKVSFLNHVVRTLKLENAVAVHGRVEDLAGDNAHAGQYDAVISRGFTRLENFVSLARPMLAPGGSIYALKGEGARKEILPNLERDYHIDTTRYLLPFEGADRYLVKLTPKPFRGR